MAIQTISTGYNPISGVFGTGQVQMFFTSGSWTVPTGISRVRARVWGGGGYNLGAAGGFSLEAVYDLTGVTSIAVTVGAGGISGATTGGTSSFGSYCSATGGGASTAVGAGSGGDINYNGGAGNAGGGGVASIFGNGVRASIAGPGPTGGAGGGSPLTTAQGGNGFMGVGGSSIITTAPLPPGSGLLQFSIDFIGTGGGAGAGQNGINGGGGAPGTAFSSGGIPGGGGGNNGNGGQGLVIVEW